MFKFVIDAIFNLAQIVSRFNDWLGITLKGFIKLWWLYVCTFFAVLFLYVKLLGFGLSKLPDIIVELTNYTDYIGNYSFQDCPFYYSYELVNHFLPLKESLQIFSIYFAAYGFCALYRFIRSWIPFFSM